MARRKDSIALFEVIGKNKPKAEAPTVPDWMNNRPAEDPQVPPAMPPAGQYQPVAAEPSAPKARSSRWLSGGEPIVAAAGNRMRITLSYTGWAIAGVALLAVLTGVFVLGRTTTSAVSSSSATAGVAGPSLDGEGKPAAGGVSAVPASAREKGNYYLVIQAINDKAPTREQMADGEKIVEFLQKRGVSASVELTTAKKVIVLSYSGFASYSSQEAQEFARKVETLGKEYMKSGGHYNFGQTRNGQFAPWYTPYKPEKSGQN